MTEAFEFEAWALGEQTTAEGADGRSATSPRNPPRTARDLGQAILAIRQFVQQGNFALGIALIQQVIRYFERMDLACGMSINWACLAIYSWFTEGCDTAALIEAKTLLDALAGRNA